MLFGRAEKSDGRIFLGRTCTATVERPRQLRRESRPEHAGGRRARARGHGSATGRAHSRSQQCRTRRPRSLTLRRSAELPAPPSRSAAPRVRWERRAGRGPGPRACSCSPRGWRPSPPTSLANKNLRRRTSFAPPVVPTRTLASTVYELFERACWPS